MINSCYFILEPFYLQLVVRIIFKFATVINLCNMSKRLYGLIKPNH